MPRSERVSLFVSDFCVQKEVVVLVDYSPGQLLLVLGNKGYLNGLGLPPESVGPDCLLFLNYLLLEDKQLKLLEG